MNWKIRLRRLLDKTDRSSGCWIWPGAEKYRPTFQIDTFTSPASRAVWRLCFGALSDEWDVLHHCDNIRCVNPEHFFLGTQADNNDDMMAKGKYRTPPTRRGEDHPNSKLSARQIEAIIDEHRRGTPRGLLASRFMVTPRHISRILRAPAPKVLVVAAEGQ